MTVRDILEVVNENITVSVYKDGKAVAIADGKDTIDEEYFDSPVKEISGAIATEDHDYYRIFKQILNINI